MASNQNHSKTQSPPPPQNQFAFVSWKPSSQRSRAENLRIRSHCARGKNKRADSRRSRREASKEVVKQAVLQVSLGVDADANDPVASRDPRVGRLAEHLRLLRERVGMLTKVQSLPTLVQVDPSLAVLAKDISCSPRGLLHEFTTFRRISEAINVLEKHVDYIPNGWPDLPPLDSSLVHSILLINNRAYDYSHRRSFTDKSAIMQAETLGLLNKKLTAGADAFLETATIWTIMFLGVIATTMGDLDALKAHMAGLNKIITTLGGLDCLWPWVNMGVKLQALDMVLAMSLGSEPYFLKYNEQDQEEAKDGCLSLADIPVFAGEPLFAQLLDPRLKRIFRELRDLSTVLNQHLNTKKKVKMDACAPVIRSVSARLLHIERTLDPKGTAADHYFCLGMLLFALSLFQVPSKPPVYAYMTERLRSAATRLMHSPTLSFPSSFAPDGEDHDNTIQTTATTTTPPALFVKWLLIMTGITIMDPMDPWLHDSWAEVAGSNLTWKETHVQVKDVLWIDVIHNNIGKALHTVMTSFHSIHKSPDGWFPITSLSVT